MEENTLAVVEIWDKWTIKHTAKRWALFQAANNNLNATSWFPFVYP